MNITNKTMPSIHQINSERFNQTSNTSKNAINATKSFESILQDSIQKSESIKFSKHANSRLETRDINLSSSQIERLNQGVKEAREKGINDSLMLMDDVALVVNVKNNVVVTALNQNETKNHVFTNIDGAVVL